LAEEGDLQAAESSSALHADSFVDLDPLPIPLCCPFDSTPEYGAQLARAVVDERQSIGGAGKRLIAKERWSQGIWRATHLRMCITHRQ
jgi:hypothetical protein